MAAASIFTVRVLSKLVIKKLVQGFENNSAILYFHVAIANFVVTALTQSFTQLSHTRSSS
jgi:hypothetical protein